MSRYKKRIQSAICFGEGDIGEKARPEKKTGLAAGDYDSRGYPD
jgi:hypothetical protein